MLCKNSEAVAPVLLPRLCHHGQVFVVVVVVVRYGFNSSDCSAVRASASEAVDLGLITNRVKPIILKLVLTASLLEVQH